MAAETKERAFILKWRSAVWRSNLPASAKLCCMCLSEFSNSDGSNCYPSLLTISEATGLNEKTVRRNLKLVADAGFIKQIVYGTTKGWKAHRYLLTMPDGADTTPVRNADGADTMPAANDPEPEAAAPSSGHCVHLVRTLCPDGTGMVPTDLSNTYPLPILKQQRHHAANTASTALPDWVDPESWAAFAETFLPYPLTAPEAQAVLEKLASLRATGQDPNWCLDTAAINGWRDVFPTQDGPPNSEQQRPAREMGWI